MLDPLYQVEGVAKAYICFFRLCCALSWACDDTASLVMTPYFGESKGWIWAVKSSGPMGVCGDAVVAGDVALEYTASGVSGVVGDSGMELLLAGEPGLLLVKTGMGL
jgi:hypothetical protein